MEGGVEFVSTKNNNNNLVDIDVENMFMLILICDRRYDVSVYGVHVCMCKSVSI